MCSHFERAGPTKGAVHLSAEPTLQGAVPKGMRGLMHRIGAWRLRDRSAGAGCLHDGTPPLCFSCTMLLIHMP